MLDLDRALVLLIRGGLPPLSAPAESPSIVDSDWTQLIEHAQRENLAALFYVALKKSGRLAELPSDLAESLRIMYLRANVAHWQATRVVEELFAQFEREQIPVILLKGAALGVALYPDPATRQLGDLDLLVHEPDKARADELMRAVGFQSLLDLSEGFREDFGIEQAYIRRGKQSAAVEIHWNLIKYQASLHQTMMDWFWARTMDIPLGERRVPVLGWDAQLLHLTEHFVIHHRMRGLRWSCDIALLLAKYGNALNWDQVIDAARQVDVLFALNATLAQVDDMWGVRVPAPAHARLFELDSGIKSRASLILHTVPQRGLLIFREGFAYSGWRRKVAYFVRYCFPHPEYMRTRYRIARSAQIPFFYLVRLGLGARQLFESLGSIVRNARKRQVPAR